MSEATALPSGLTDTGTGGDSLTVDLNERYDLADLVWVMTSGVLVWIMIPGIGLLYSGMARKRHALSLLWASMMTCSLVSFQWFFWGYTLVFAHDASNFLGTMKNFCLMDVLGAPSVGSSRVPDIVFCFFQGMFAAVTGILMVGGASERARLGPMMVFLFIWLTVVYCPIAEWTWNANGWLAKLGSLDFAGGGPVHMASGAGALAYALVLGKRKDPTTQAGMPKYKPHSVTSIVFGTVFLWFGWFGFNGGSSGNATIRGFYAAVNTNLAAACAGLTWMFVDYIRTRRWSVVGLCCGIVAGLVGITPAAGFVPVYFAVPIGAITGIGCNFAVDLKDIIKIDDGMDVFALHGVGGFIGSVLTGLFSADYIAALDGATEIDGGWLNHHYKQLGYQLAAATSTLLWSFVVSSIILYIMDRIPFLKLRLDENDEQLGTDLVQIGEFTFQTDDGLIDFGPLKSRTAPSGPVDLEGQAVNDNSQQASTPSEKEE